MLGCTTNLPAANAAGDDPKEGVSVRALNVAERTSQRRAPPAELGLQVTPLVFELADGLRKTDSSERAADLRAVEGEAAAPRLGVNMKEVGVDECDGVRPCLESVKLGMMAIAARATEKDLASKEGFPPESRETLGIEIARMDGPESHGLPRYPGTRRVR